MPVAIRHRHSRDAVWRGEGRGAVLAQLLRVGERHETQLAACGIGGEAVALAHLDRAIPGDGDVTVGELQDDRSGIAEHLVARQGDDLTEVVELERAVTGVALAARRLHHEHAFAVDGDIKRATGLLDRALAHVMPCRAVLHEADAAVARGELVGLGAGRQVFREHRAVRLEAGGVHVGDIVGHEIELALKRGLPR